jgi:hypothetical protein
MLPLSDNALDDMVALERDRGAPALTNWESLSASLRAEGLIRDQSPSRFGIRPWMQIAAGLVLAVGGAAAGRISAGAPLVGSSSAQSSEAVASQIAPATQASGAFVSNASATVPQFKSADEAWDALNRSGEEYQRASAYLSASNAGPQMTNDPSQYRTRLAALDNVMTEIRGALKEAPQDPVINQYYVTTVGAREATLRQLGATLKPAGVSLNRF